MEQWQGQGGWWPEGGQGGMQQSMAGGGAGGMQAGLVEAQGQFGMQPDGQFAGQAGSCGAMIDQFMAQQGGGMGMQVQQQFPGQFGGCPPQGQQYYGGGKGKGYGKSKGKGKNMSAQDFGIPGFNEALNEALMPHIHLDPSGSLEEMKSKVAQKIVKAAHKMSTDERLSGRCTSTQAKALIEEFIDTAMSAVSAGLYDKMWLEKANFSGPLFAATLYAFQGAKIFTRTIQPIIEKHVEEALFNYKEEERIQKAMWDAVVACGVKESHRKKANNHLSKAYDEAHLKSNYGSSAAETPELGLLQDFVRGWMGEFVRRGWDVLENGIGNGSVARDEQVLFVTVLFQTLTDAAGNACLPHDLTTQILVPPPSPWAYIGTCAEAVFADITAAEEQAQQAFKRPRTDKGMGKGKMDMGMGKGMEMGGMEMAMGGMAGMGGMGMACGGKGFF